MIDTHAHIISEFFDDIDELVTNIKKLGVIAVVNNADSLETSKEVFALSKKYNNFLFPTIGIHPENIDSLDICDIEKLEGELKNNKYYAIGEIGLDYHWNKDNKEKQILFFEEQIKLAIKYNLPIVVHTRESIQDTLNIIKKYNVKGIIHCFSGSVEIAREFIKKGFLLGIGGVLTFKNSNLYKVIEDIPMEYLLLETDSPFLSPEPHRGEKNIPSNISYVAKKIASIKNISYDDVIKSTTSNAKRIFNINV